MPADSSFFKRFPNNYFIESGTYLGFGCEQAVLAGFKNVISFEVNKEYYNTAKNKCKIYNNVKIIHGDTVKLLWDTIKDINDQITFWLDGHYFLPQDVPADGVISTIMKELDIIYRHPVKTHKILIDDIRLWKNEYGIEIKDVEVKIKSINSNYGFTYETGHETLPNDIFVAKVYA